MKFTRIFTEDKLDVYKNLKFKTTSSEIKNPDGTIVFSAPEIEVPGNYSQVAADVIAQKYFRKAGVPAYLKKVKESNVPEWLSRSEPDEDKLETIPDPSLGTWSEAMVTNLLFFRVDRICFIPLESIFTMLTPREFLDSVITLSKVEFFGFV